MSVEFPIFRGTLIRRQVSSTRAVQQVTFSVPDGGTFALVGESGCGKTTLARSILRVYKLSGGAIYFGLGRENIAALAGAGLRRYRLQVQTVFQDPFSSLDPRMKVIETITEPLRAAGMKRSNRLTAGHEAIGQVGLPPTAADAFPHEFSGGQRQRIAIARALVSRPRLIVLDEPVSSLDVSIRAQILNLLMDLQARLKSGYLIISHDLVLVRAMSQRVAIMYLGRIVEMADTAAVFAHPRHPYSQMLLRSAAWSVNDARSSRVPTEAPSSGPPPVGCPFHPRCPLATDHCRQVAPPLETNGDGHAVACHYPQ